MARRVSLPKVDDLFRATTEAEDVAHVPVETTASPKASTPTRPAARAKAVAAPAAAEPEATAKKPSGRVKHDAKMTVYITDDELMDIEHARLSLRRSEGIIVDRGRLVREAVAIVLAELETKGPKSALVKRLRGD